MLITAIEEADMVNNCNKPKLNAFETKSCASHSHSQQFETVESDQSKKASSVTSEFTPLGYC